MWAVAYMVILPLGLIMKKLCKRVRIWESLIGGFFFNTPLRTIIEMYIEIALQVLINTKFIKFSNMSQLVTTAIALLFGTVSLLLPFIAMSIIYHNRRNIRKH